MVHPLSRNLCKPKLNQVFVCNKQEYQLRGELGNGAAGIVRKAVECNSEKIVAIKFIAPDPKYINEDAFDDVARRFQREGERGLSLKHHHLIEILGYSNNINGTDFIGHNPKNPFIIMQHIDGQTLESYIRSKKNEIDVFSIDPPKLGIAMQISTALKYLKNNRLIHRDVKPSNIFLSKMNDSLMIPNAKLGDFGVMKWGDFHASVSTGTLTITSQKGLGTLKYMSPEQALKPKNVTFKTDIYSLGITLYELFTNQILATPHHVYEIANARRAHGNTASRFNMLEIKLNMEDEGLADIILDMFLAAKGRPNIEKIVGRLEWEFEHRYGVTREYDLY